MIKKIRKVILIILSSFIVLASLILAYIIWIQPIDSRTADHSIGIARKTEAESKETIKVKKMPKPNSNYSSSPQSNLRSKDLSQLNLTSEFNAIKRVVYDTSTKWPRRLPKGFDPDKSMELGKNPGLHVQELHKKGITGKGVSVGIIDQTLYTEHSEYKKRLKHYEEIHALSKVPEMHGAGVASLAVGENIGVAPESNLYFIASSFADNLLIMLKMKGHDSKGDTYTNGITYKYYAQSIERFLEINKTLPEKEKIRAISISRGFNKKDNDYNLFKKALDKANDQGILVVTATLEQDYGRGIAGLGKEMMSDPDDRASYSVGSWLKENAEDYQNCLFLPMDCRTYAGITGEKSYVNDTSGGLSWVVPYLAGLYALAYQVNTSITPETFIEKAIETSDSQVVENEGKPFTIKYLINPIRLIEEIQSDT